MKTLKYSRCLAGVILFCITTSCQDYVEIDAPQQKIVSQTVFASDETALSAMQGIYNQLASAFFSSGGAASVTVLAGISSDVVSPIHTYNRPYMEFNQHEILPDNFRNLNLWSSAYNIIYMTNSILEGLEDSNQVSEPLKTTLQGQAKFVRAFSYFYLVNLYGEVPLILTTDYSANATAGIENKEKIYQQILSDLQSALEVLDNTYSTGERTEINKNTVIAFLARVQLFQQKWAQAEKLSSQIIEQSETYQILDDLNQVFLANSKEAIWQLSPLGRGDNLTNTLEGSNFIINPFLSFLANLKLNDPFANSFSLDDKRLDNWIAYVEGIGYYPFKYKISSSTGEATEYSMVLRLAEQYLIRAEARLRQGDIDGAMEDINIIRNRAGLPDISEMYPDITQEKLLDLILQERKHELFAEWGHRWLDIKRTGRTGVVFGEDSLWQNTDVLYPIPETERIKDPNLPQNNGY